MNLTISTLHEKISSHVLLFPGFKVSKPSIDRFIVTIPGKPWDNYFTERQIMIIFQQKTQLINVFPIAHIQNEIIIPPKIYLNKVYYNMQQHCNTVDQVLKEIGRLCEFASFSDLYTHEKNKYTKTSQQSKL